MSWVPKADCFALGFISQVVSPRFADIIRVHVPESDLQLIPVPIRHHESGSILHGYCIVNVLRVVDCVDLKKSSAVLSEDINGKFSYEFHRLGPVLDLGKIPADVMVFRLHQALNYVLINEEFAALVKKHKIRKFPFRKVRIELL